MAAPKGKLLIIGGAEDIGETDYDHLKEKNKTYQRFEILSELLKFSKNKKIEIITTGSLIQDEVKKRYKKAFAKIKCPNPGFLPINDKMEAHDKNFLARIKDAGAIFFTGGDQFRLSTILGGTPVIDIIKKRYKYDKDFLVAGTSAGAMAMSGIMITSGGKEEALLGSDLKTTSGLGLLRNCIIDTHFIKRGRFGRLAHAIIINPGLIGIGLGEDTALIIKNGSSAECRGSGMVVIIDGKFIRQTNITDAGEGEPVFVENFKVHLLVKGCRFSIKTRKLAKQTLLGTLKSDDIDLLKVNHPKKIVRRKTIKRAIKNVTKPIKGLATRALAVTRKKPTKKIIKKSTKISIKKPVKKITKKVPTKKVATKKVIKKSKIIKKSPVKKLTKKSAKLVTKRVVKKLVKKPIKRGRKK